MMSPYNIANYQAVTPDMQHFDVFSATYDDIRFAVPVEKQIKIDSANEFNLPGLAFQYLGHTSLWWALLMFNGLTDPLNDVKPGVTLNIPERSALLAYLGRSIKPEASNVPSMENATIL